MKLIELIADLSNCGDDLTIYASKPWTRDSVVVLAREPVEGGRPPEAEAGNAEYFIEVFIAKEFLDGWLAGDGRSASQRELCERLIHYAIYDA